MDQEEDSPTPVDIGPGDPAEAAGLVELLRLRPPAFWMRKVSDEALQGFVTYAVRSPRAAYLAARAQGGPNPAGYIFAVYDARRFWLEFALRNPGLSQVIFAHRLLRLLELRRGQEATLAQAVADGGHAGELPRFSWSPSGPANARIVGLFVREEHRRKGIALSLYLRLFEALKSRGVARVEEYMGPDYPQYAGKFPEVCGWQLQRCSSGGYKLSKEL